jgi:hypothetical protein
MRQSGDAEVVTSLSVLLVPGLDACTTDNIAGIIANNESVKGFFATIFFLLQSTKANSIMLYHQYIVVLVIWFQYLHKRKLCVFSQSKLISSHSF